MSLATQIRAQLQSLNLPPPSQPWLQTLITARTPPPPLPSLVMTAKTRLLASDLTTPGLLDAAATTPSACFPPDLVVVTGAPSTSSPSSSALATREARLARDVYVQVVDLEDLSRSRWEQVEELEAVERGERTRGREVIRLPVSNGNTDDGSGAVVEQQNAIPSSSSRNVTHRLVLQDCMGQKAFALELMRIPRISIGTLNIGEKILLRKGTVVARGTIMLEPSTCVFLGGKVEPWQKAWVEGRLARLKEAVGPGQGGAAG